MTARAAAWAPARAPLLVLLLAAPGLGPVRADDLNGYFELRTAEATTRDEVFGIGVDETSVDAVDRRLYFLYNRQAYPRLRFWVGGTFDDVDATTRIDGQRFDSDDRRLRPYVGVGQRTHRFITQLSWNRDERRSGREDAEPLTTIRDGFFGSVSLAPEDRSAIRGRLLASRNYDRDANRQFRDVVRDSLDLEVNQQVTPELRWGYRGTLSGQADDLTGNDTTTTTHRGEVGYSDSWIDRRVTLDSQLTINHRESVVESSGSGEVEIPLFPLDGLSARDDTPLLITLAPEPALIDDDIAAPTPIDLGLPPPAGDDRPWAIGLDLGTASTVNTLFVWVDRDLDPAIATSFSWEVYTSANNLDWNPAEFLQFAPFDEFLRRFVSFPVSASRS